MIKKLVLFAAFAMASTAAWAGYWAVSVSYPSNPSASSWFTSYFYGGTTFTANMQGVGRGGGVSLAVNTANGQIITVVNAGGGPGQAFNQTSSGTLSSATNVYVSVHLAVDTAGAYGTSSMSTNW